MKKNVMKLPKHLFFSSQKLIQSHIFLSRIFLRVILYQSSLFLKVKIYRSRTLWVEVEPPISRVDVGGGAQLTCRAGVGNPHTPPRVGNPQIPPSQLHYTWYKDGRLLPASSRARIQGSCFSDHIFIPIYFNS